MRSLPEHRPSWLSTILFALVVFMFFRGLSAPFVDAFLHAAFQSGMDEQYARQLGGEVFAPVEYFPDFDLVRDVACCFGVLSALVGAWAWRSASERRFHITFLSGLALLIADFVYACSRRDGVLGYVSDETDLRAIAQRAQDPVVAMFASVVGVVLILTALIQDRRN